MKSWRTVARITLQKVHGGIIIQYKILDKPLAGFYI